MGPNTIETSLSKPQHLRGPSSKSSVESPLIVHAPAGSGNVGSKVVNPPVRLPLLAANINTVATVISSTSLSTRRQRMGKQLFLVVPSGSSATQDPTLSTRPAEIAETRSCPPTPRLNLDTQTSEDSIADVCNERDVNALKVDLGKFHAGHIIES